MKIIGITGGIGSGKSLVAKILKEKYNAHIVDTDGIAKRQMEPGGVSFQAVVDYFGTGIVAPDGSIDRKKLSEIVFCDPAKRIKVNELTHPKVLVDVKEEICKARETGSIPYVVVETALMIESGYDYICDEVWYVFTPEEERRRRLKQERQLTDDRIDTIFRSQSKEADFRGKFSIIIENTGDIELLEEQVERILMGEIKQNPAKHKQHVITNCKQ